MAIVAKAMNRPFYVVAESYKFSRMYPLTQHDIPWKSVKSSKSLKSNIDVNDKLISKKENQDTNNKSVSFMHPTSSDQYPANLDNFSLDGTSNTNTNTNTNNENIQETSNQNENDKAKDENESGLESTNNTSELMAELDEKTDFLSNNSNNTNNSNNNKNDDIPNEVSVQTSKKKQESENDDSDCECDVLKSQSSRDRFLTIENDRIRDYTPPQYITLLFTDLGILTPSAVSDELLKLYQ